jgi:multidrug resistance efflux pump
MQPQEIKGWLELDALQKNIRTMSTKYENLQAHLKEETNLILEKSMHAAQELAQQDPYAALIMNYDMQRLIDKVDATSIDIDAINEKYKKLSNEIKNKK